MKKVLRFIRHPIKSYERYHHRKTFALFDLMFNAAKTNGIVKTKEEFAEKYLYPYCK